MPEEAQAARQKKATDAVWMATLPIKLPVGVGGWGRGRHGPSGLLPLSS